MFIYSLESILIISTSLFVIDLSNLNVFVTFIPATISLSHEYSSKLSADKNISTRDVLAVSSVVTYKPSGLKYTFTSLSISFSTSHVDFIALACIVASFMILGDNSCYFFMLLLYVCDTSRFIFSSSAAVMGGCKLRP